MNHSISNMGNTLVATFNKFQALKFVESIYAEAIKLEKSNWLTKWESDHSISANNLDNRIEGLLMQKKTFKEQLNKSQDYNNQVQLSCLINIV